MSGIEGPNLILTSRRTLLKLAVSHCLWNFVTDVEEDLGLIIAMSIRLTTLLIAVSCCCIGTQRFVINVRFLLKCLTIERELAGIIASTTRSRLLKNRSFGRSTCCLIVQYCRYATLVVALFDLEQSGLLRCYIFDKSSAC